MPPESAKISNDRRIELNIGDSFRYDGSVHVSIVTAKTATGTVCWSLRLGKYMGPSTVPESWLERE